MPYCVCSMKYVVNALMALVDIVIALVLCFMFGSSKGRFSLVATEAL